MNPRMDCYNTEPLTVTAGFAINQYTLAYVVNPYGTLSGDTSQTVSHGDAGTAVTVLPSTNCSFVQWSDGSTANPRTDSNVTGDITVTAVISPPNAYVLQYTAGPHGAIQGAASQTVVHGNDGTAVTAVPDTGYYFLEWSDSRTDNPRTDVNVTGDSSVAALFAANQYTLSYAVGDHGWLSGPSPQTVAHGATGTYVAALPDEGYRFAGWSDGWTSPHGPALNALRRDTNITHDVDATAAFTRIKYNLTYTAGANGALSGETAQQVDHGYDGTPVLAVPEPGYYFVQWSDARTDNPRTDLNVQQHLAVTAFFADLFDESFSLPAFLQDWMDFLRDAGSVPPLDTLAWFRDDPTGLYNYVLSLQWGSTYNFWIAWAYAALHELNAPLELDCLGRFNLHVETQDAMIPDLLEMYILELILKDATHPLHTSVLAAYWNNLALWQDYHATLSATVPRFVPPAPSVVYALAAHSTLDATGAILAAHFHAVHLSRLYGTAMPVPPSGVVYLPELHHDEDLDCDGFTNFEEFAYVDRLSGSLLHNLCSGNKSTLDVEEGMGLYADYIMNSLLKPPPEPEPWSTCECEPGQFTLKTEILLEDYAVGPTITGEWLARIDVEPQKETYAFGERVCVTYVDPLDTTNLLRWEVSPRSHTAHNSPWESAYIYITGNTTVKARFTAKRRKMISITAIWPDGQPYCPGIVSYPGGYHEVGSSVKVQAIPAEGHTTRWTGMHYSEKSEALLSGVTEVNVYLDYRTDLSCCGQSLNVDFPEIVPSGPGQPTPTGTVIPNIPNAKILTSGGYCKPHVACTQTDCYEYPRYTCHPVGPYLSNSASAQRFCAEILPNPSYFLSYWEYTSNNIINNWTTTVIEDVWLSADTTFHANLVPGITLELSVEGQGGIVSSDFSRYYNPKIYKGPHQLYDRIVYDPFEPHTFSNRVKMTHQACPGWAFSHWEIRDEQGDWMVAKDDQDYPIGGDLTVWMNWWNGGNRFHVPEGQLEYDVKAVFICDSVFWADKSAPGGGILQAGDIVTETSCITLGPDECSVDLVREDSLQEDITITLVDGHDVWPGKIIKAVICGGKDTDYMLAAPGTALYDTYCSMCPDPPQPGQYCMLTIENTNRPFELGEHLNTDTFPAIIEGIEQGTENDCLVLYIAIKPDYPFDLNLDTEFTIEVSRMGASEPERVRTSNCSYDVIANEKTETKPVTVKPPKTHLLKYVRANIEELANVETTIMQSLVNDGVNDGINGSMRRQEAHNADSAAIKDRFYDKRDQSVNMHLEIERIFPDIYIPSSVDQRTDDGYAEWTQFRSQMASLGIYPFVVVTDILFCDEDLNGRRPERLPCTESHIAGLATVGHDYLAVTHRHYIHFRKDLLHELGHNCGLYEAGWNDSMNIMEHKNDGMNIGTEAKDERGENVNQVEAFQNNMP